MRSRRFLESLDLRESEGRKETLLVLAEARALAAAVEQAGKDKLHLRGPR